MNAVYHALLSLAAAGIRGMVPDDITLSPDEWYSLLTLSREQEILPLTFDTASKCRSYKALPKENFADLRRQAIFGAIRQAQQTNEFLTLMLHAQAHSLHAAVLKGIAVRSLYPVPILRPSIDEDLLIPPDEAEAWHRFLLSEGLSADDPDVNVRTAEELSYHRPDSPTYIELHISLFASDSQAYGELNSLFGDVLSRTIDLQVEDVTLQTLSPTDHILYLLCHAFKHFLHSGVGIRQAADIAVYANRYREEIGWQKVYDSCAAVHMETFAAALFRIGQRYLTLEEVPTPFAGIAVDEAPLLLDMFAGGVYGTADEKRAHSSNITLDAVAAQKQGRREAGILHSLFPGKKYLQRKYPYAKKYPVLLPAAWAHRMISYLKKNRGKDPGETARIGRERVELLRKYKVLE